MPRLLILAGVLFFLIQGGCRSTHLTPDHDEAGFYTARAVIVRILPKTDSDPALILLHEAIPDFRNEKGQRVGMSVMAMPFFAAKGVSLKRCAAGDKVKIKFRMDGQSSRRLLITKMEKLPKTAELSLDGYWVE